MLSVGSSEIVKVAWKDAAIAVNKLTKKLLTANYYRIKRYHVLVTILSIHLIYTIKRNLKSKGSSLFYWPML